MTALLAVAPIWLAAGAVAWLGFRLAGGPALRGPVRWGLWFVTVGFAVVAGWTAANRSVWRGAGAWRDGVVATAVGWGVAVAAGWFFDVEVGGPFMGMVTACALCAAPTAGRAAWGGAALALAAGLVGTAAGVQLSGARGTPLGLLAGVVAGLLAVFGAGALLKVPLARGMVALLTCVWGGAWFLAWALAARLPPDRAGMSAGLSAEVALAVLLGGVVTGVVGRRSARLSLASALLGAGLAVGVSWAVHLLLNRLLPSGLLAGSGRETYLDVGNVIGLALAAAVVVGPVLAVPGPATDRGAGA